MALQNSCGDDACCPCVEQTRAVALTVCRVTLEGGCKRACFSTMSVQGPGPVLSSVSCAFIRKLAMACAATCSHISLNAGWPGAAANTHCNTCDIQAPCSCTQPSTQQWSCSHILPVEPGTGAFCSSTVWQGALLLTLEEPTAYLLYYYYKLHILTQMGQAWVQVV